MLEGEKRRCGKGKDGVHKALLRLNAGAKGAAGAWAKGAAGAWVLVVALCAHR